MTDTEPLTWEELEKLHRLNQVRLNRVSKLLEEAEQFLHGVVESLKHTAVDRIDL